MCVLCACGRACICAYGCMESLKLVESVFALNIHKTEKISTVRVPLHISSSTEAGIGGCLNFYQNQDARRKLLFQCSECLVTLIGGY